MEKTKEEILDHASLMLSIETGIHFFKHMRLCEPKEISAIYDAMQSYADQEKRTAVIDFLRWMKEQYPGQKCMLWPPCTTGLENTTNDELYDLYLQ
jgi:hypothetical protein